MQLDRPGQRLYLRVVYAGPSGSGKTTALRALAAPAVEPLASLPRGDPWFDWTEYEGGVYRDCRIRCQIVATVGSPERRAVRQLLVQEADAVVFVADARRANVEEARRSLAELRPWLERAGLPRVELVLLSTRAADATALGIEDLRRALGLERTVDAYGGGSADAKPALVAAVRAGLRRAEALRQLDRLPAGKPEVNTAERLLEQLEKQREPADGSHASPVPEPPRPAPRAGARPAVMPMAEWLRISGRPRAPIGREEPTPVLSVVRRGARPVSDPFLVGPPTPWVAGCAWELVECWPPSAWRAVVDAARSAGPSQDWPTIGRGWRALAVPVTEDPAYPRAEYARLTSWLKVVGDRASRNRCIALTHGAGRWSVVQLVQRVPTLDGMVRAALDPRVPHEQIVELLARAAESFLLATTDFDREGVLLPIRLQTILRLDRRALYADFLPARPQPLPDAPPLVRVQAELRAVLGAEWLQGPRAESALNALDRLVRARPRLLPVASVLQSVLADDW